RDHPVAVRLGGGVAPAGPAAARVLATRPGAVRTAAHRGLKRLARQLGGQDPADEGATDGGPRTPGEPK
ncbi:RNA polymerase sigma factor, partial [Streptomyces sp. NPDC003998]